MGLCVISNLVSDQNLISTERESPNHPDVARIIYDADKFEALIKIRLRETGLDDCLSRTCDEIHR